MSGDITFQVKKNRYGIISIFLGIIGFLQFHPSLYREELLLLYVIIGILAFYFGFKSIREGAKLGLIGIIIGSWNLFELSIIIFLTFSGAVPV